jgi:drug/metabolite transporter (DMT)-like permease
MSRVCANILLLLAALCWGTGNVAQQTVLVHIGPFAATGLKSLIAAIVMLPYCLIGAERHAPLNKDGLLVGAVVVLSFVAATTLMQMAYGLTSVTNAGFLVNTATVLTPLCAMLFLRQKPTAIVWPAAFITLFGAILMGGGRISALSSGDLLSLGSAVCFAVWMVSLGEFVTRFGRAKLITITQFTACAFICLPGGLLLESPTGAAVFAALPELLYIGIVSTGLAYLLQAIAQRYTSCSEAAVIVSAEAVFGAAAAAILLGEQLNSERAIGALCIITSIILVQVPIKLLRRPSPPFTPTLTPGE